VDVFKNNHSNFSIDRYSSCPRQLAAPKDGTTIYVVEPGGSLWKISCRFFSNSLLRPRLWELNPYIDNPSLIYPGDVISSKAKQPNIPFVKVEPKAHKVSLEDI
jgi:nucleoid-associated protein YgaU